jgi:DNA-binding transcriptional MerR regulator
MYPTIWQLSLRQGVGVRMPVHSPTRGFACMTAPCSDPPSTLSLTGEELYPIREVARATGINPVTLRAWERRYGLIQPTRTESGHRLYSQADIDDVRSVLMWIERGVAVSKVGKILARGSTRDTLTAETSSHRAEWSEWQAQVRRAVAAFDELLLERVYGQVFSSYPLVVAFQEVLMPVWQGLLTRLEGYGRTSEWLFLDSFLRARALQRLHMTRGHGQAWVVVVAALGECRELELLVAGLMLGGPQVDVHVLGLGQPLDELSLVCEKTRPHAMALFSDRPLASDQGRRVQRLAMSLECPLMLMGEASEMAQEAFIGTPIACLGGEGRLMQRRLLQYLEGHLDT